MKTPKKSDFKRILAIKRYEDKRDGYGLRHDNDMLCTEPAEGAHHAEYSRSNSDDGGSQVVLHKMDKDIRQIIDE